MIALHDSVLKHNWVAEELLTKYLLLYVELLCSTSYNLFYTLT